MAIRESAAVSDRAPRSPAAPAGDRREARLLTPRPRGATAYVGRRMRGRPVWAFLVVALLGIAATAAVAALVGWLLTTYVLASGGIGHADGRVNVWFAQHRTGVRTDASLWLSRMGDVDFIPALVALTAIVAVLRGRNWGVAAFVVAAAGMEALVYRVVVLGVHRDRPRVGRLDNLPVNHSYYSGHTAAAVAAYCGVALVISARVRSGAWRAAVWAAALVLPVLVGLARLYRGEHHPTDVVAGVLVGVAMLLVAGAAVRAARAAAAHGRSST